MGRRTRVQHTASVDEKTVKQVAKKAAKVPRAKKTTPAPKSSPVTRRNPLDGVHPALKRWVKLNHIPVSLVEKQSATEILVVNPKE